jgi:hypothetical protein
VKASFHSVIDCFRASRSLSVSALGQVAPANSGAVSVDVHKRRIIIVAVAGILIARINHRDIDMKQKFRVKVLAVAPLMFMLTSAGCESIALLPRQAIDDRGDVSHRDLDRRELDRRPESRPEIARPRAADELTGTVQKVDQNRREIQLRTTEGRMTVIKYDPATVVYNREREMPVDDLRYGDLILIKVIKNDRGEQYADLIRLAS